MNCVHKGWVINYGEGARHRQGGWGGQVKFHHHKKGEGHNKFWGSFNMGA